MVDSVQIRFSKPNPIVAVAFKVHDKIYRGIPTDTHGTLLLSLEESVKISIVLAIYSAEALSKPPSEDIMDGFITDIGEFVPRDTAYNLYK
jgi:hypothetical protein